VIDGRIHSRPISHATKFVLRAEGIHVPSTLPSHRLGRRAQDVTSWLAYNGRLLLFYVNKIQAA